MADVVQRLILQAKAETEDARRKIITLENAAKGLGIAFAAIGAAAVAAAGALAVAGAAALKQQAVFDRLAGSIAAAGIEYDEARGKLTAFFAEQQRFTQFGDDVTAGVTAQIAGLVGALGPTTDELIELTALAQDMSVALGIGLPEAAKLAARGFAGVTEPLAEFLPAQRDFLRELAKIPEQSGRSAAAIELLQGAFGGAAREINQTRLGIERTRNAVGDIVEAFGAFAVTNGQVGESINAIADALDAVAAAFDPATEAGRAFGEDVAWAISTATGLILELGIQTLQVFRNVRGASLELSRTLGFGERGADQDRAELQQRLADAERALDTGGTREGRAARATAAQLSDSPLSALVEAGVATQRDLDRVVTGLRAGGMQYERAQAELDNLLAASRARGQELGMQRGAQLESETAEDQSIRALEARLADASRRNLEGFGAPAQDARSGRGLGGGIAGAGDAAAAATGPVTTFTDAANILLETLQAIQATAADEKLKAFEQANQSTAVVDGLALEAKLKQDSIDLTLQLIDLELQRAEQTKIANTAALQASIDASDALTRSLQDGTVNAIAAVADGFGALALSADEGLGAVGASALRAIGSLASQTGQFLLLAGLGFSALPLGFSGAGAIGAGVGLIALGGLLGAASGATGGGGSSRASSLSPGSTGIRSTAAPAQQLQQAVINDYTGATFIGSDPSSMRKLLVDQEQTRQLGGVRGGI